MDTPREVKGAVHFIYTSIAISTAGILLDKISHGMDATQFIGSLIICGLSVIIPYKIANRSNGARYFYIVVTIISILAIIGGVIENVPLFSTIADVISLPISIVAMVWLFSKKADTWFKQHNKFIG
jgi:hypothetical protein